MTMRIQEGQIYALDTGAVHAVGADLLSDAGDVSVIPHDLMLTLQRVSDAVTRTVQRGRVPIVLGGDDSLLFACARGLHDAVTGQVGIVHFDAHLDLMDDNERQGRFSHSSGMRRALDLQCISTQHCIQVGSRNFNFPSSFAYKRSEGVRHISAVGCHELGVAAVVDRVLERVSAAEHILLAFDIDAVDPSAAPGAGHTSPAA